MPAAPGMMAVRTIDCRFQRRRDSHSLKDEDEEGADAGSAPDLHGRGYEEVQARPAAVD